MMLRENKRAATLKKIEDYKKSSMRMNGFYVYLFFDEI